MFGCSAISSVRAERGEREKRECKTVNVSEKKRDHMQSARNMYDKTEPVGGEFPKKAVLRRISRHETRAREMASTGRSRYSRNLNIAFCAAATSTSFRDGKINSPFKQQIFFCGRILKGIALVGGIYLHFISRFLIAFLTCSIRSRPIVFSLYKSMSAWSMLESMTGLVWGWSHFEHFHIIEFFCSLNSVNEFLWTSLGVSKS